MLRKLLLGLLFLAPLSAYPFLRNQSTVDTPEDLTKPRKLTDDELFAVASLVILSGQPFSATLPWEGLREVGEQRSVKLEKLAKDDPLAFLEECMDHYKKTVKGYKLTFVKWENVNGKKERIICHFRDKPFSVHMDWKAGRGKAIRTLYVEGENNGMLVARPVVAGFESPVLFDRPVDDPDAMKTSRFPITEFGIYKGAKSTVDAMHAARKKGTLTVRYEGIHRVKELGDRPCYKFVRTPYSPSDWESDLELREKLNELVIFIDKKTLLQGGSILLSAEKDADGKAKAIAEYWFRDIELNPEFHPDQFTRKKL